MNKISTSGLSQTQFIILLKVLILNNISKDLQDLIRSFRPSFQLFWKTAISSLLTLPQVYCFENYQNENKKY